MSQYESEARLEAEKARDGIRFEYEWIYDEKTEAFVLGELKQDYIPGPRKKLFAVNEPKHFPMGCFVEVRTVHPSTLDIIRRDVVRVKFRDGKVLMLYWDLPQPPAPGSTLVRVLGREKVVYDDKLAEHLLRRHVRKKLYDFGVRFDDKKK